MQIWVLVIMARQMRRGHRARRGILEAYEAERLNWDISDDPWIPFKAMFRPSSIFLSTDSPQVREAKNNYLRARDHAFKAIGKACAVQVAALVLLLLAAIIESFFHKQ